MLRGIVPAAVHPARPQAFVFILACLLALLASSVHAQLSTATVTGVVRDASGGVVPKAIVILKNVATGVGRPTVTNAAGNYALQNLPPRQYTLEITAFGFKSYRFAEFTLAVNQTLTMDAALELGRLEESVQVEASAEGIESATAELGSVMTQMQVSDLPLNGRNFSALLSLTPGAAPINVSMNFDAWGTPIQLGADFQFPAVNGQTNRSNLFMTDGINNQSAFVSTYAVPPIIDTIQEFKVVSHNDLAEFGSSLGGIVNVVTKSGSNALHGSAWEYVQNDAFDARNTYLPSVTPFRQNEFGFTLGGPVYIPKLYNGKNRTFFYGGLEEFLYRSPAQNFFRVPTPANYAGDLSDVPGQIYNPFSTRRDPSHPGQYLSDPFPNNRIPGSMIDPTMLLYAKTTLPRAGPILNGTNNAIDPTPLRQNVQNYTYRVDQAFKESDFVWFRYSYAVSDTSSSGGRRSLASRSSRPATNYGASWVHTFSPTLVLQAQFGHANSQDNGSTHFQGLPAGFAQSMGFAPRFAGNFVGGVSLIPDLSVDGFFGGGESEGVSPKFSNIYQWSGNVSKIHGNHTFKWGGEWSSNTFENIARGAFVGYTAQQTGNPSDLPQSPGSSLASYLLNVPGVALRSNIHGITRYGGVMSFYFQDSWKATPKLTVNWGLRYDRTFQPPWGTDATIGLNGGIETGNMNFNDGTYVLQKVPPTCATRGFAPCLPDPDGRLPDHVVVDPRGKIYHDSTRNFGPRFGLAYRLDRKTAIRSSFGIFYDNWAAVTQTAQNFGGSWPDTGSQNAPSLNLPAGAQLTPVVKGQDPFASGGSALPAATPFSQAQYFMDPYARNPYSMQWNFGVQRQLNGATSLTLNYVGSGSRRLDVGGFYNTALTPGPGDPQSRAPYPYIAPTFYDRSIGKASYNGLQFQLDRRYAKGLAYQISYTWSKSIDIASSGWYGFEGHSLQNPYDLQGSRGPSGFDLTHVFSIDLNYELPIGKGKVFRTGSKAADYILGTWQINSIFRARSGQPYEVRVSEDIANTGDIHYERANLTGDPNAISKRTWDQYINTAAFQIPAAYSYGNLGRDSLRTDPYWQVDASIFRVFPFKERMRFEFRAEAFNAFNNVIYGQPGSDMADTANFGRMTGTANRSRQLQLGAKFLW